MNRGDATDMTEMDAAHDDDGVKTMPRSAFHNRYSVIIWIVFSDRGVDWGCGL